MARSVAKATPRERHVRAPRGTTRGPAPVEEEIYRLITEAIVAKQLRPGGRLKEAALATQFGVSRARVRRVLRRLAELDFVEFRLNHGALIRRPTPDEARAVFATRRLLEAEAVRNTMKQAAAKDYARLRAFVADENRAFETRSGGLAGLSSGFHILLGEMCGNPVMARILNQLVHRCVLLQSLYERQGQPTICLVHEHAGLVDLMEAGKVRAAVAAMEHHLDHIEASLDYDVVAHIDERIARSIS
jgi:DNA-binding GntR family transcriptional regulator